MTTVLDDLDTRPGSASSLLHTLVGASLRDLGGWMSSATAVALLGELGVSAPQARNALSRAKSVGLLASERRGRPGYALTAPGRTMLERGDRRIFSPRRMSDGDAWCLISFSVPEDRRRLRHQLRKRLSWLGCGVVAPGLWICPEFLSEEVVAVVGELELADHVTTFAAQTSWPSDANGSVSRWWDLAAIAAHHERFLVRCRSALAEVDRDTVHDPAGAFRAWMFALDAWRPIPYLDPGLPPASLPPDWPGNDSIPLFLSVRDRTAAHAADHVRQAASAPIDR